MAFLSFKWLAVAVFSFLHPFYVSVTEINHNAKDQSLEISCKVFSDDMENVLKQNYKVAVDFTNPKQQQQIDQLMFDYFSKHLALSTEGQPVKLNYVGFEKDSESVYCYLEATSIRSVKKIDVSNSILHDLTPEQINIMHVTVGGNRKSYKLDFPKKQASFHF